MKNIVIKSLSKILAIIALSLFIGALMAWPVQELWNWLMPSILGLKTLTLLEAWGLGILFRMVFSSANYPSPKENKNLSKLNDLIENIKEYPNGKVEVTFKENVDITAGNFLIHQ